MTNYNYRPLGTKVLLKILPPESDPSPVLLPDGQKRPGQHQYFEVVAVGSLVNDDKWKITPGETVMIAAHPSQMIGVNQEKQLMLLDREFVVCAVEPDNSPSLN